jgi:hypothetical protein
MAGETWINLNPHTSVKYCAVAGSGDSSVCIATGYGLDGRGSFSGRDKRFSLLHNARPALGPTHPPIHWVPGALSPGLKRPEREADHSLPSSAEFKNSAAITPLPQKSSWRDA